MTAISESISEHVGAHGEDGPLPVHLPAHAGEGALPAPTRTTEVTTARDKRQGRNKAMTLAISYILVSVFAGAIGQLLLKHGMNHMGAVTLSLGGAPAFLLRLALNPFVVGGLFLYACGTVFWLAGLSRVDLSFAYPFASLSYVVMLLASWQLFDENITLPRLIGTAVIATGVLIVSRG